MSTERSSPMSPPITWPAKNPRLQGGQKRGKQSIGRRHRSHSKAGQGVWGALVEDSSSLSSSFGHLFFIEQFQAGADDFRHGIYDRTRNLVRDDFVGLCRQAAS